LESERWLQRHRISKRLMELQLDDIAFIFQIPIPKFVGEDFQPKRSSSSSN
jgi:hypothetical protein